MPGRTYEPIPKPRRVRDPKAIAAARKNWCEYCGTVGGRFEVHHIKSRGAGGPDERSNLINLCVFPTGKDCHGRVHRGLIPRPELQAVVARRDHRDVPHPPRP